MGIRFNFTNKWDISIVICKIKNKLLVFLVCSPRFEDEIEIQVKATRFIEHSCTPQHHEPNNFHLPKSSFLLHTVSGEG